MRSKERLRASSDFFSWFLILLVDFFIKFFGEVDILSDEFSKGGIFIADPPPLEYDDGHQHQYYYYECGGEGNGNDVGKIHTLCLLNPMAKVCKQGWTVVPPLQIIVSILQNLLFCHFPVFRR